MDKMSKGLPCSENKVYPIYGYFGDTTVSIEVRVVWNSIAQH